MKFKRILSAVLASTMIAGAMCVSAFADTTDLPTATVTELTGDELDVTIQYDEGDEEYALNYGLTFAANESADEAKDGGYKDHKADYVVSFNKDVEPEDVILFGRYESYANGIWVPIPLEYCFDETIKAGTEIKVLSDLMDNQMSYYSIVKYVNSFDCGIWLNPESNLEGLTVTLSLCLYDTNNKNKVATITTNTYTVPTVASKIDVNLDNATTNKDAVGYSATVPAKSSYTWTLTMYDDKKFNYTADYGTVVSGEGNAQIGIVITGTNGDYGTNNISGVTVE